MTISNRPFGIELEIIRGPRLRNEDIAQLIKRAGARCYCERYGHDVSRTWKIVSDGSVGNEGCEIVSPKLFGEAEIAEARRVADAIREAGCYVSVKTGFHCHVDASDYDAKQMASLGINYLWFETFSDHVMPASRRGSENYYVKSNRAFFAPYGTTIAQRYGTAALNTGIEKLSNVRKTGSIQDVINAMSRGDRYYKLNLTVWNRRQKSVEFRQHSGTIEADKVEHWIRLCVAFVEKCRASRPRPRSVPREWSAAQEMRLFFSMFNLDDSTRAFYTERRRTIAAQERQALASRSQAQREADAASRLAAERAARELQERAAIVAEAAQRCAPVAAAATIAMDAIVLRALERSGSARRVTLIRSRIRQIEEACRNGMADRVTNLIRDAVRRRMLPIAVARQIGVMAS